MRFEKETIRSSLPDGEYSATVAGAEEGDSTNGHPMLTLIYDVDGPSGVKRLNGYHLVGHASGDKSKYQWSINMLADAFGTFDGPVRQLIGERVNVKIRNEEFCDAMVPKIDRVLAYEGDSDQGDWGS